MDRRVALKNMGLALGYTVAIPTLLSIAQSCKNEKTIHWTPDFFSKEEGDMITQLVDIILPKTDTPSASEVQVQLFIDRFANQVMTKQEQDFFKMSMGKFMDKALKDAGKEPGSSLDAEELKTLLATTLKVKKEDEVVMLESINAYQEAQENPQKVTTVELDESVSRYAFANNLRGITIWAYKTSEYVGEKVLAYLPVPGEYIACGDVEALTQGKAWSL